MINKTIVLISIFVFLFVIEKFFPLRGRKGSIVKRSLLNISVSVMSYAVAFLCVAPAIQIGREHSIFSFQSGVIAFLLFDVTFYYWHWLNHKIPLLWRFHNVHHFDGDLDVTTAFRFHFVEVGYSSVFRFVQAVLIGAPVEVFALYEFVFQLATFFHHSNWKLPINLEKYLSFVFVTPRVHGIHHSQVKGETNSNYSVIFSFWDRLHKTFVGHIPQKEIVIGVPAYTYNIEDEVDGFVDIVAAPFFKQKDYWNAAQSRVTTPSQPHEFIAE